MIYCGIATIPIRLNNFRIVVGHILPQVDVLFVALNGHKHIPSWLICPKIEIVQLDNSLGDIAKFYYVESCNGTYVTLDDDLIIPRDYVKRLSDGLDKYGGVVGFHGRIYTTPMDDFKEWYKNYTCLRTVDGDYRVNIIGSGCCAFNTESIKLKLSDFKKPNMADVWLSKKATEMKQPMTVLKHNAGDIKYLKPEGKTIWHSTEDYGYHLEILRSYIK